MQSIINILTWFIKIVIIAVLCIWMPIILWHNPLSFESFVKLVELLISWPMVIAFLAMIILTRFKSAIDHLLRNIRSVSFPGGNIQTQAAGDSTDGSEDSDSIREYTNSQQPHFAAFSGQQQNELQEQLRDAKYSSSMWKFSYLNMFYVPITKQVLLWLSGNPSQTKQNFHLMWQSQIPDPTQRETILNVLIRYGMLQVQATTLSVTNEGEYFLRYLGLKPSAPENTQ